MSKARVSFTSVEVLGPGEIVALDILGRLWHGDRESFTDHTVSYPRFAVKMKWTLLDSPEAP